MISSRPVRTARLGSEDDIANSSGGKKCLRNDREIMNLSRSRLQHDDECAARSRSSS
jgi:hypothetical protein